MGKKDSSNFTVTKYARVKKCQEKKSRPKKCGPVKKIVCHAM